MAGEDHKAVVRAYVEAFNRGDMDALRALFTPDASVYGVLGGGPLEGIIPIWQQLHDGLNVQLEIVAMAEEGDTVAVRYVDRGTSVAEFMGHAATGRSYEVVAMEWFVMHDGLIHQRWGARDSAAQFRQMGFA